MVKSRQLMLLLAIVASVLLLVAQPFKIQQNQKRSFVQIKAENVDVDEIDEGGDQPQSPADQSKKDGNALGEQQQQPKQEQQQQQQDSSTKKPPVAAAGEQKKLTAEQELAADAEDVDAPTLSHIGQPQSDDGAGASAGSGGEPKAPQAAAVQVDSSESQGQQQPEQKPQQQQDQKKQPQQADQQKEEKKVAKGDGQDEDQPQQQAQTQQEDKKEQNKDGQQQAKQEEKQGQAAQVVKKQDEKSSEQTTGLSKEALFKGKDKSSYANTDEVQTEHISFNLNMDLNRKVISGFVDLQMRAVAGFRQIVLDSSHIDIKQITYIENGAESQPLQYMVDKSKPILGDGIVIDAPSDKPVGTQFILRVNYQTIPGGQGPQWLGVDDTKGGNMPYMYTQCQPIYCRSIAPMQDSLAIKITYDAKITVERHFMVRMSALSQGFTTELKSEGESTRTFTFLQDNKIPPYLIAIAAGDLVYKSLGQRVGVISEPSQMKQIEYQMKDMQKYVDMTEQYLTPFPWKEYTVLILPGLMTNEVAGMENPYLTIVQSTKPSMVLHELAHSWFGNSVTCATWPAYWLNEGLAVFVERKMSSRLFGVNAAKDEKKEGEDSMQMDLMNMGSGSKSGALEPEIQTGQNPEKYQSQVQYEKGYQFFQYLENLIGEEIFRDFLREYLNNNQFSFINTPQFVDQFKSFVQLKQGGFELLKKIEFDKWIYEPGMPPVAINVKTEDNKSMSTIKKEEKVQLSEENSQDANTEQPNGSTGAGGGKEQQVPTQQEDTIDQESS